MDTTKQFNDYMETIGWGAQALARQSERCGSPIRTTTILRWQNGQQEVPPAILAWLKTIADFIAATPIPPKPEEKARLSVVEQRTADVVDALLAGHLAIEVYNAATAEFRQSTDRDEIIKSLGCNPEEDIRVWGSPAALGQRCGIVTLTYDATDPYDFLDYSANLDPVLGPVIEKWEG